MARQLCWYEIRRRRKARAGKNSFPPTPSFLPARAIGFQNLQSGFSSKKVRILTKRHRQLFCLYFMRRFSPRRVGCLQRFDICAGSGIMSLKVRSHTFRFFGSNLLGSQKFGSRSSYAKAISKDESKVIRW